MSPGRSAGPSWTGTDDLDGAAAALTAAGVEHGGPVEATSSRVPQLADPDGNRVVLTGR